MIHSSPSLEVERFGCFGKLPVSREFIVEGSKDLSDSGFDRWIGGGVGMAKARLGTRFDERIRAFPRYRFFWDGAGDRKLAGVICPSKDAAGRKHPFTLFACLRGRQSSALSTALQVWSLQEQTEAMLDSVSAAETPAEIRTAIRSAQQESPPRDSNPKDRYQRFLEERKGDGFWRALGKEGNSDGRFIILQALVETLNPLRKNKSRAFRGGIRYPLSRGDRTEVALESCFWLDLTEKFLGHAFDTGWWLRSPCGTEEDNRYFFFFLSPPSGNQWVSLIDPADDIESISYLDRPYGTEPPEQRMDPKLRAVLSSEASTFSDYLRWASGS